jgi:ATP-dependent DNA helicase RecG
LPEPEFIEEFGGFSVCFYKDIYTEENLSKMDLNERQIEAIKYIKEKGKITNTEYQKICNIKKRQTTDDLKELVQKELIKRIGVTGKGTYYILRGTKGAKGAPNGY